MLSPTFTFSLNNPLKPNLAVCGKFDGSHPSLVCATSGGRLVIHSPHDEGDSKIKYLNVNREITSLSKGCFGDTVSEKTIDVKENEIRKDIIEVPEHKSDSKSVDRDVLLIGSPLNLLAYDVHENADKFYIDVPDGVDAVKFGKLNSQRLAFVGGNCSLQGFDRNGAEKFWTVTGGRVKTLELSDIDEDGIDELLVGSEDFEIRIFKEEESTFEIIETEAVTHLCKLGGSRYGYGLANGTIGVYSGATRVWRVKAKDHLNTMTCFDIDGDGIPELITGWKSGKFEARRISDGQVVYREKVSSSVCSLVCTDYRMEGKEELLCITADGEIRGYLPFDLDPSSIGANVNYQNQAGFQSPGLNDEETTLLDPFSVQSNQLVHQDEDMEDRNISIQKISQDAEGSKRSEIEEDINQKRLELRALNAKLRQASSGGLGNERGDIPPDTSIEAEFKPNIADKCLDILVSVSQGAVIRTVIVYAFDGGIFENECHIVQAKSSFDTSIAVPIKPFKNIRAKLKIQALVSGRGENEQLHVFEIEKNLEIFQLFVPMRATDVKDCLSGVRFSIKNLNAYNSLVSGLLACFGLNAENVSSDDKIEIHTMDLRDGKRLSIIAQIIASNACIEVKVQTDDIHLAGEVVNEIGINILGLKNLESIAEFSENFKCLEDLLISVEEKKDICSKLTADMADYSHTIKALIVQAEDSRMFGNMVSLQNNYQELFNTNQELMREHQKRCTSHEQLVSYLKEINSIIQSAAKLRLGKPKQAVIQASRKALQSRNTELLIQAIANGA